MKYRNKGFSQAGFVLFVSLIVALAIIFLPVSNTPEKDFANMVKGDCHIKVAGGNMVSNIKRFLSKHPEFEVTNNINGELLLKRRSCNQ